MANELLFICLFACLFVCLFVCLFELLLFTICVSDLLGEEECQHVYSTVHKKKKEVVDEPSYMNTDTTQHEPCFYDETTQNY